MTRNGRGDPLVSVVIPAFNVAPYIGEAIESVLGQELKDVEILAIDDGSTDGTREAVGRYGSAVTYIYQPNQGVSAARNAGIRLARGKYVAFLDADDAWLPDKLERQVRLFEVSPEVDVVFSDYEEVGDARAKGGSAFGQIGLRELLKVEQIGEDGFRIIDAGFFEAILRYYVIHTSTFVAKRDVFCAVRFDESMRIVQDKYLWLCLAKSCRFAFVDCVLSMRRFRPGSLVSDDVRFATEHAQMGQRILQEIRGLSEGEAFIVREGLDRQWYPRLAQAVRAGALPGGRRFFFRLVLSDFRPGAVLWWAQTLLPAPWVRALKWWKHRLVQAVAP